MNQQFAPSDLTVSGQGWESLGTFTAASGTLNVGLSDNADGIVDADAVMILPVQPPTIAPSMVDNSDGAFSESGTGWQGYSDSSSVNGGFRYCTAGTGENTATWTFANVSPTAQYQIYATWSAAGLPAHLVLTGNGVAVINNDQVDIWDWDNLDDDSCADCCPDCCSPSTNWVLVPRKPQEQGTMDYDESSNTFTQTVDGTQYIFDGPDPDDDAWDSPNDFGLLSESIDPYGNQTDYYYQHDGNDSDSYQLASQIWTVGPDVNGCHSQEQIAYDYSDSGLTETVTLGCTNGTGTGAPVPGTGGEGEPAAVYWYTDGEADQTVGSADFVCNGNGDPELIETYDAEGDKLSETDPDKNKTTYGYDGYDELASQSQTITVSSGTSVTATTTYNYDADGNLLQAADADANANGGTGTGSVIVYAYNSVNEETSETWYNCISDANDQTGATNLITRAYDADGELLETQEIDCGAICAYQYTYNSLGQQTSVDNLGSGPTGTTGTPGVPDVVLTASYDADGNRRTLMRLAQPDGWRDANRGFRRLLWLRRPESRGVDLPSVRCRRLRGGDEGGLRLQCGWPSGRYQPLEPDHLRSHDGQRSRDEQLQL